MITNQKEYKVDKRIVRKYLKGLGDSMDLETEKTIQAGIDQLQKIAQPQAYSRASTFKQQFDGLKLLNFNWVIKSTDLFNHLEGATKAIVLGVTLGPSVDQVIKQQMLLNPSKGYIYDAVASVLVESLANSYCEGLVTKISSYRNARFSPGYGDFSLADQSQLLNVLSAQRTLGVYANDQNLLVPQKSITAIFGLFSEPTVQEKKCYDCSKKSNCSFLEKGVTCYA